MPMFAGLRTWSRRAFRGGSLLGDGGLDGAVHNLTAVQIVWELGHIEI